jgi:hypothetical protein
MRTVIRYYVLYILHRRKDEAITKARVYQRDFQTALTVVPATLKFSVTLTEQWNGLGEGEHNRTALFPHKIRSAPFNFLNILMNYKTTKI